MADYEGYPEPSVRTVYVRGMSRAVEQDRQLLPPIHPKPPLEEVAVELIDPANSGPEVESLANDA